MNDAAVDVLVAAGLVAFGACFFAVAKACQRHARVDKPGPESPKIS